MKTVTFTVILPVLVAVIVDSVGGVKSDVVIERKTIDEVEKENRWWWFWWTSNDDEWSSSYSEYSSYWLYSTSGDSDDNSNWWGWLWGLCNYNSNWGSDYASSAYWWGWDYTYTSSRWYWDSSSSSSYWSSNDSPGIGPSGVVAWTHADFEFSSSCSAVYPQTQGTFSTNIPPILPVECGSKNKKRSILDALVEDNKARNGSRIVGGVESSLNEWPWLVAIGHKNTGQFCGGTLISDQFVVTAAHCIGSIEYPCHWNIRLGEHNLYQLDQDHVDMEAENIWIHPDYDGSSIANDIAVIKLAQAVDLSSEHIGPACLPESIDPFQVDNLPCYVAGWGTTSSGGSTSAYVQHVDVTLYSDTQCSSIYGTNIKPGMICAGLIEGGADSCQGDSGGPLVCQYDNHWDLVGVVSWGFGCAQPGFLGVYSSTPFYLDWIQAVISHNS